MAWKKFALNKEARKWSISLAMKVSPSARRHVASSAASLRIRTAETPADWQIAHSMLDEEHLLGAGREAGDRLCQFILEEDEIVAVLIWCAAAWHLHTEKDATKRCHTKRCQAFSEKKRWSLFSSMAVSLRKPTN